MNMLLLIFLISIFSQLDAVAVNKTKGILSDLLKSDAHIIDDNLPNLLSRLDEKGFDSLAHVINNTSDLSYNASIPPLAYWYNDLSSDNQVSNLKEIYEIINF